MFGNQCLTKRGWKYPATNFMTKEANITSFKISVISLLKTHFYRVKFFEKILVEYKQGWKFSATNLVMKGAKVDVKCKPWFNFNSVRLP